MQSIQSLLDNAARLSQSFHTWNNRYMYAVLATAVLVAFTFIVQWKAKVEAEALEEANNAVIRAKDDQLKDEFAHRDERIAQVRADAQVEIARAKAESDEKIATANERAGEANRAAGRANAEAARLSTELVTAQRELEKEKLARIEVERSIASRTIPRVVTGGKANFDVLKPYAGTNVVIQVIPEWEARRAASDIAGILLEAGWVIKDFIVVDADLEDGVEIESYLAPRRTKADGDDPLKFTDLLRADMGEERQSFFLAEQLEKFLTSSNWEVATIHRSRRGELSANTIRVNVGLKPTPYDLNPQVQEMKQRMKETMQKFRADQARRDKEMEEFRKNLEGDPRFRELMKPKPPLVLRPPEEPEKPKE